MTVLSICFSLFLGGFIYGQAASQSSEVRRIDLNAASVTELLRLPKMDKGMASAIVASRPFSDLDDLRRAKIPPLLIKKWQPLVYVTRPRESPAERDGGRMASVDVGNGRNGSQGSAKGARTEADAKEQAQVEAEARAQAEAAKREADAARAQAAAEANRANQAAAEAGRLRQQAENEKNQLREQLLRQFNAVLPTRETPRGLVVDIQDVLFDTGKYTLKEAAREALAKISGIVISHPGLDLQVEGYTDNTGSERFNQKLSEERANTVRDYLASQGLSPQSMTAVGYGENYPVASNDTAAGRRMNRRVQLVLSGEVIGVKIGVPPR
jgi:outer membrane protein OmpA-like peptidoglycan-associated protein